MSVPHRPPARRPRASIAAWLALCTLLASAGAVHTNLSIDNGDFENGFTGWLVVPTQIAVGTANAVATATIQDGGLFLGTVHPVTISLFSDASGANGPSSSQVGVHLTHPGVASGRFLDFKAAGGWGIARFGGALLNYRAEVVVRGKGPAAGKLASFPLAFNELVSNEPCTGATFADYALFPMTRRIDLAAAGFRTGDPLEVEFFWQAAVVADEPCEQAEVIGTLFFDDFAFRN